MKRRKTLRSVVVEALKSYPLEHHGQPISWTIGRDALVGGDGELDGLATHLARHLLPYVEAWRAEGGGE